MKSLRFFFSVLLLCTASLAAKADIDGFKLEILDPTGGPYLYYVNGVDSIPFSFGVCPSNNRYAANADGCFTAYNNTSATFSSVALGFDNYTSAANPTDYYNYLNGQKSTCDTTPATTAFPSAPVCGLNSDLSRYNLVFSGGTGFVPGEYIVIAEFGASQFAFKNASLTVFPMLATPEPGSLWLLATGVGMPAGAWWRRRRATSVAQA